MVGYSTGAEPDTQYPSPSPCTCTNVSFTHALPPGATVTDDAAPVGLTVSGTFISGEPFPAPATVGCPLRTQVRPDKLFGNTPGGAAARHLRTAMALLHRGAR